MFVITEKEFQFFSKYIEDNYGIHLKTEKQTLVTGRLHNLLTQMGFTSFTEYFEYLLADKSGDAVTVLLDKITTNHTFFMRESEHFDYFREKALPHIARTMRGNDLRIWCAASSSGEEPYTLAIILNEFVNLERLAWDKKILATDIANNVLNIAKSGIYSNERLGPLPKYWRLKFFEKYDDENSVIRDEIKNEVIFRRFNLVEKTFPFKKRFHVIFCRNVMIYFDNHTKNELIQKFYDALEVGGYLFIGHSESLNKDILLKQFRCVSPSVYQKI